jgi:hypothetical protein
MKKYIILIIIAALTLAGLSSCHNQKNKTNNMENLSWEDQLKAQLPLLGHRNWIVITDMAYPLQSAPGIQTLYAKDDFASVLTKVKEEIDSMPHIFAHVYHDKEMDVLTDSLAPGIDKVKAAITHLYGERAQSMVHEDIIRKLDTASSLYKVVIIKTPLTIPYTSVFLELDCKYWDAKRQAELDKLMK